MEVKAVNYCVPLCLLSLGNSRFTIEKSALFYKLWCVQCQFFFLLALSYRLPLKIMSDIFKCRLCVRAQCEGKKRGVKKGPLWCPATGWAQLCVQSEGSPGAVHGCLAQGCCGWQGGSVLSSAHLLGTCGWSRPRSKQGSAGGSCLTLEWHPSPGTLGRFLSFGLQPLSRVVRS